VRINYGYKSSVLFPKFFNHAFRVRELLFVPGEVGLVVGVLDVEPDEVTRDLVILKLLTHLKHLRLTHVIPSALVVAQRWSRWHQRLARGEKIADRKVLEARWHVKKYKSRSPASMMKVACLSSSPYTSTYPSEALQRKAPQQNELSLALAMIVGTVPVQRDILMFIVKVVQVEKAEGSLALGVLKVVRTDALRQTEEPGLHAEAEAELEALVLGPFPLPVSPQLFKGLLSAIFNYKRRPKTDRFLASEPQSEGERILVNC